MKAHKMLSLIGVLFILSLLGGCSNFTGIRNPLYDGKEVVPNEKAIDTYRTSGEIIEDEKANYFRYLGSEDIYLKSLDYPEMEPVLLEEGSYIIGEDIPAGRASLLGNESVFSRGGSVIHVGNLVIYDEAGEVYFENMFHSDYGPLSAQVDLIPGHRIEITGTNAEITVFFQETFPEDPYVLMDPPELLVNLERLDVQQPLTLSEDGQRIQLSAGIYEVGQHIEPGTYRVTDVQAVHTTELFLFEEGEEPRVFELLARQPEDEDNEMDFEDTIQIELHQGQKIYPSLVHTLQLTKVEP
jgi:hypothetical protein